MRTHPASRWLFGAAVIAAAAASPRPALAEEAIALDRFHPAPAGDRMLGVPSPFTASSPGLHAMMLVDYAHDPFVFRRKSDSEDVGVVVGGQLFLHLNASYALWSRLGINLDLPIALYQSGSDPDVPDIGVVKSPSGAQIGDLRLGLRVRIYGEYFDAFQLAVGGYMWIPTGSREDGSFVSDGKVRGMPQLIAGGRTDRLVWSVGVGPEFRRRRSFGNVAQGPSFLGGAGLGILVDNARHLQIGAELTLSTVLRDPGKRTTNGELLLSGRYRFLSFMEAAIGIGPGITAGVGTPDVRVVGMIAYTPEQKKTESPPSQQPPPDQDRDGIFDMNDACPDAAGPRAVDPRSNGCPPPPPDADMDGSYDVYDACPYVQGPPSYDSRRNGCPSDRDNDRIYDGQDACADVPGAPNHDPSKNGCPPQ